MMEQKSSAKPAAEASSEDTRSFMRRVKRDSIRRDLEGWVGFEAPTTCLQSRRPPFGGLAPIARRFMMMDGASMEADRIEHLRLPGP
jgi:hypothetical protein